MNTSLTHEMPLVIFTIMAQMSVGSFVALGLIHLLHPKVPQQVMDRVTDPALYVIGPLLVLGLVASSLHLGSPLRAINALRHVDGSWLSREILAGIVFLVLGAAFAITQWFKLLSHRLRQVLALLAAVAGLVLVYCIAQVYSLRTVPAWATYHTVVKFYITAFLLGSLAVGAALVVAAYVRSKRGSPVTDEDRSLMTSSIRAISLVGILALGLKFIGLPAYLGYLGTHASPAARESLRILAEQYSTLSGAQTILIVLGIAALAFLLFRMSGGGATRRLLPAIAVTAFALVFAGEFISRMLFYASMVRIGM